MYRLRANIQNAGEDIHPPQTYMYLSVSTLLFTPRSTPLRLHSTHPPGYCDIYNNYNCLQSPSNDTPSSVLLIFCPTYSHIPVLIPAAFSLFQFHLSNLRCFTSDCQLSSPPAVSHTTADKPAGRAINRHSHKHLRHRNHHRVFTSRLRRSCARPSFFCHNSPRHLTRCHVSQ
jgi:hypothetical protein